METQSLPYATTADARRARHNGAARAAIDNVLDTFFEFMDGETTGSPKTIAEAVTETAALLGVSKSFVADLVDYVAYQADTLS